MGIEGCLLSAGKRASAALFVDFLHAFDKNVMSLKEMAESENCENDSDGVMPEAMTVVWILVDAEDCETCYDCG